MARRDEENSNLPIPNGWYAVAWSTDLIRGQVKSIHYFGEDLVLFRTREGHARVIDAYCVHLGAHLGEGGSVFGETVQCPFHGWRYSGESGAVEHIPYCERVPAKARLRAWHVDEKNGMILVWHHAENAGPSWEVPLLPEIGHPEWSEPRTFELEVPVHVQDMHENNNDPVHFQFVHGNVEPPPTAVSYYDDGRSYRMESDYERDTPMGTFTTKLIRDAWGIGLATVRSEGIPDAGLLMFSSSSPVESNLTHSRWLFTSTSNFVDLVGEDFMKALTTGVMQDMRIWSNKVHRAQPVLCEGDGYLAEYRQWVRQFYTNPA